MHSSHCVNNTVFHTVCCCLLKCTRISCKICAYFSHYTYCKNFIMAVCYSDHIQCVLTQNSEFSSSGPQSGFSGLTLVQWVIGQVRWCDLQIILPNIQDTQNTVPWPCWNTHTITLWHDKMFHAFIISDADNTVLQKPQHSWYVQSEFIFILPWLFCMTVPIPWISPHNKHTAQTNTYSL